MMMCSALISLGACLLASVLQTPKGADLFPLKSVVVPTGKVVMFKFPPGFVATNYVIQIEETYEPQWNHWWQVGYGSNDVDANNILTIRAKDPYKFYRARCIPKNQLPP